MQLIVQHNLYTSIYFFLFHDTFFEYDDLYSGATYSPKNAVDVFLCPRVVYALKMVHQYQRILQGKVMWGPSLP